MNIDMTKSNFAEFLIWQIEHEKQNPNNRKHQQENNKS